MGALKDGLYKRLPDIFQNWLVTLFDFLQYRKRHGGSYGHWLDYYIRTQNYSGEELEHKQAHLLRDFIKYARQHSLYYKCLFEKIGLPDDWRMDDFISIPIQSKEDIRSNIDKIYTIPKQAAILSRTGGTTGKSIEVRFTYDDIQNRFAMLDLFRSNYGYKLGKKVAWFSGKSLLTNRDLKRKRYWKYDWLYKIRYYSTFHINVDTIKYYIDDLNNFRPPFAAGFPSCMYEIAKWSIENNYPLLYKMKAVFPTAETIADEEKEMIEFFFGCRTLNQYASSEGAPFILECPAGNLHIEMLSGFFEVLDDNGKPAKEGELVFTSFTTHGTPLIRYAIKDWLVLSDKVCSCGSKKPVVKSIQGRTNDYIYSEERGKINLGNISNCVKYVNGVMKFQIVQDAKSTITVKVVKDFSYTDEDEKMFLYELRQRVGNSMDIAFVYVEEIPREKSGKYRIVKQAITG